MRLSYEAKYLILIIQKELETNLETNLNNSLITKIEDSILNSFEYELEGVSTTIILKVSSSSIIETAFLKTKHLTLEQWMNLLENEIPIDNKNIIDIGSLTPKLYLRKDVIDGLKNYSTLFMSEQNLRPLKISYIIKYVVYAYYKEFFKE